jgi:hypothetical protein
MANLDIVGACERIVRSAETLAGENYAFNLRKKNGALSFITSPENGGVDAELISYQSGRKQANLHVFYDQRTKSCNISENCDYNVCDDGATPLRKEFDVTISDCVKTPVRVYSNEDMTALCEDTETFMRRRGFSDIIAAHEHIDKKTLAWLDSQIGKNIEFDGTITAAGSYKTVDIIGTAGGQPVPLPGNWAQVPLDYENNQLTGVPAVIGQGNLQLFYKLQNMSCCNATTPYGDADFDGDARFYLDQSANEVLGANKFIMAAFGTTHMLTYNENANIVATGVNTADRFNIVVPDPLGYPFSWNLDFYFDNCTKSWKWMYSLLYGFFNVYQDDSFASSGADSSPDTSPDCNDDLVGMTSVFGYTAD